VLALGYKHQEPCVSTPPLVLAPLPLVTIKKRADFLRVRGGAKWSGRGFLIDCRLRPPAEPVAPARFGFTVTKKMEPSAVARNRIRRRLKEAVRLTQAAGALPGYDYVVVGRLPAAEMPFETLCRDFKTAFGRLHRLPAPGPIAV
jgi:ribonuclease P protein component